MIINFISQIDTNLFLFINHLPHNFFLDFFFGGLTIIGEAGAIWFFLAFLLFLKNLKNLASQGTALRSYEAKKLTIIWGAGIFTLALVFFLKEIFRRVRPEFILPNVILPFGADSSFSFPSGHALVSFAFAFQLVQLDKFGKFGRATVYTLAILISLSRIYLGYHYPLDVLAGAIFGISVALVIQKLLLSPPPGQER